MEAGNKEQRRRRVQIVKKPYMQFSKKIVIAVTVSVTAIALIAIGFCWNALDTVSLVDVVKAYVGYATIVFASYSGNSIAEKIVLHQHHNEENNVG